MTNDARSMTELLPWLLPLTEGLVVCKDSSLLACFEFTPMDGDSAGDIDTIQLAQAADRMTSIYRDLPVTFWWTVRREKTTDYPASKMPDPISQLVDDEHREAFLREGAYRNRHFLSVLWMPPQSVGSLPERIGILMKDGLSMPRAFVAAVRSLMGSQDAFAWRGAELDAAVGDFESRLEQMSAVLSGLKLKRLRNEDLFGFLWAQANPGVHMTRKKWQGQQYLDALLPERPISVYRDTLQFGDGQDATYGAVISLKEPPAQIDFDAFSALLALPCEFVLTHCFRLMGTQAAINQINSSRRLMDLSQYSLGAWLWAALARSGEMNERNADPAKAEQVVTLTEALGAVSRGSIQLGWHHTALMLLNSNASALAAQVRSTLRLFHASPFVGAGSESLHALSSWATSLPGQWQECRRWLVLSSTNANNIAPLMGVGEGERMNGHLTEQLGRPCPALTVLHTPYGTPYYFNFHVGALGHCFVVGPSRSGKSAGMNFLMSQYRKYAPDARVIIFDKDRSCRIPTLLQGGKHIDLRPGGDIRLNPLRLVTESKHWAWLQRWIEGLIGSRGYKVTSTDAKAIFEAIQGVSATSDTRLHTLETLLTLLPQHLQAELENWVGDRPLGAYFSHEEDSFDLGTFTCLEMNEIMREPMAARAVLDYAFYRLQILLEAARGGDTTTTLVYVEEAWFLIEDEQFNARLRDWLKTFAKLNANVVLCTQSIEDLTTASPTVFAAIRDNVPTRIFLPNPAAMGEDLKTMYRKQFLLRDDQIARIASAVPKRDYYIVKPDLNQAQLVRLPLTKRQLAVVRSDMLAQQIFEGHYARRSPNWAMDYIEEVVRT